MENRNGLVTDVLVTQADGYAEREAALRMLDRQETHRRITLGADKGYDTADFVAACRARAVTPLALGAAGLPAGLTFTNHGDGTGTVAGNIAAPAGTYVATFWVSDGTIPPTAANVNIVVAPEDATLSYTGDTQLRAGAPAVLRASISQASDGSPGDLTKAAIFFDLTGAISGATTSYGPVSPSSAGQAAIGLPVGWPSDVYSVAVRLASSNGYFAAPSATASIIVFDPARSSSGSGWVLDLANKSAFAFNAKYGPGGNVQGQFQYSYVENGQTVKVKMTSPSWLVAHGQSAILSGTATLNGGTGYRFLLTVVDNGQGGNDTFGLVLTRSDGTVVHALALTGLGGGNLSVQ